MGNKIIVEFDREELQERCKKFKFVDSIACKICNETDKTLIRCNFFAVDFKIKEYSNGNKRTED